MSISIFLIVLETGHLPLIALDLQPFQLLALEKGLPALLGNMLVIEPLNPINVHQVLGSITLMWDVVNLDRHIPHVIAALLGGGLLKDLCVDSLLIEPAHEVSDHLAPHGVLGTEVETLRVVFHVLPAEDYLPGRVQPDIDQRVLIQTPIGMWIEVFQIMLQESHFKGFYATVRNRLSFAV